MNIYNTYLDLPRGAEWMIRGAEKHHPLGFKQHPLEDAGIIRINEESIFVFHPTNWIWRENCMK